MAKFHINENGDTKPCKASVRPCAFGIHGESKEEAREIYERRMEALEGSVEMGFVSRELMNKHYGRAGGRFCEHCGEHGSHHTDKHDHFARAIAFTESVNCCGVPDCFERTSCQNTTSPGHQQCGTCDDHGIPRHRCGCMAEVKSSAEDFEAVTAQAVAEVEAMTEVERAAYFNEAWSKIFNPVEFTGEYRNVKKMPAVFVIDRQAHSATTEVNPSAAWIFEEGARATIKRDGTSITIAENGEAYSRRSVKKGKQAPPGYIEAEVDPITGHSFGLEPVKQSGFYNHFLRASLAEDLPPGTYELCGPKINGNPESLETYELMPHGADEAVEIPDLRTVPKDEAYALLKEIFTDYKRRGIEGVVWHGANDKRAKLRVKDFFGDPNRR